MKKTFYIFISTVLGILLSFLAHALIEVLFLNWADKENLTVEWHEYMGKFCALPPALSISLFIAGALLGIWIGFIWWKIVYIEKKRGLFLKIKD